MFAFQTFHHVWPFDTLDSRQVFKRLLSLLVVLAASRDPGRKRPLAKPKMPSVNLPKMQRMEIAAKVPLNDSNDAKNPDLAQVKDEPGEEDGGQAEPEVDVNAIVAAPETLLTGTSLHK